MEQALCKTRIEDVAQLVNGRLEGNEGGHDPEAKKRPHEGQGMASNSSSKHDRKAVIAQEQLQEKTELWYERAFAGRKGREAGLFINLAWTKLSRYYTLTNKNMAVAPCPSMKFEYFEVNWAEHLAWTASAKGEVRAL